VNEIAGEYEVHPNQLTRWKKQVKDSLPGIFRNSSKKKSEAEDLTPKLYEEIGRLKMEVDRLKKNLQSCRDLRSLVEPDHPSLSVAQQCELLGLPRSTYYYVPIGETPENLKLMRLVDEKYTAHPFYGYRKMTTWLRELGSVTIRGELKAGVEIDEENGLTGHLSQAETEPVASRAQGVPVPAAWGPYRAT